MSNIKNSPDDIRFAADVMVGRLARWLRILGYDTIYHANWPSSRLAVKAQKEERVLLTRSRKLIEEHPELKSFLVKPDNPKEQLHDVKAHFQLGTDWIFTRCTLCNVPVDSVPANEVEEEIPEGVINTTTHFYRCPKCGKLYWEGSHIKRFKEFLEKINQ